MVVSVAVDERSTSACTCMPLEYSYPIRDGLRAVLGHTVQRAQQKSFARATDTQASFNYTFNDVVLDPMTGLIFQADGTNIARPYPVRSHEFEPARLRAVDAREAIRGCVAFCGFNRHWHNHGHWLTECVPAIAGYEMHPEWANGVLLLPPLDTGRQRMITLAQTKRPGRIEAINPDRAIVVERLVVSSLLAERIAPSPFCAGVFERMRDNAAAETQTVADRLYIGRRDSAQRPMCNEEELLKRMIARGFEPVIASELTIEEQIVKFRAAKIVVGPHGSGMANIGFCQPGCVVYELFPDHYVYPFYKILADQTALHYWADAHAAHGTFEQYGHRVPWTVDLDRLEHRLDEISLVK